MTTRNNDREKNLKLKPSLGKSTTKKKYQRKKATTLSIIKNVNFQLQQQQQKYILY